MNDLANHVFDLAVTMNRIAAGEPPISHLQIAAWKRHEQRLEAHIIELQNELDALRTKIRNTESR